SQSMAADSDVVIQLLENSYKFVPSKDGDKVERIEINEVTTYLAKRANVVAVNTVSYNDFVKLNKASGGEVKYGAVVDDDIFFDDSKAAIIACELKKAGATAKTTVSLSFLKPAFFTRLLLTEPYEIERATYTFELPASMESRFSFEPLNIPADKIAVSTERKGDKVLKVFTVTDLPTLSSQTKAPSRSVYAPQINIHGFFANTTELYHYLRSYIEPDPDPESVKAKALELTKGCATDAERIDTITRFVHENIRYVAVEHGDYGHRPDHPSEVLRKLYGDCKGSASLLAAMFQAVGLDGRRAWIGTSSIPENWSDNPSVNCGNHMIAAIVMPGDSILFVDGTAYACNPPLTPTGIQGKQALIENGDGEPLLAMVPQRPAEANTWRSEFIVDMAADGTLSAHGTLTLTGSNNAMIVNALHSTPPAKQEKMLTKLLIREAGGSEATLSGINSGFDMTTVTGSISGLGKVKSVGDETYVELNPMPDIANYKFDTKDRVAPGKIDNNNVLDLSLTLNIPDGMEAVDLPTPVSVDSPWLKAEVTSTVSDDGRSLTRRIVFLRNRALIPVSDLKTYNADIARLQRACAASIILKPITQ
ncbi:MAG: transglutaminase-like domain-containing protein, partial [Muribaculaceae bacterium]|nr:transglutaminase-like domain-containing protein [Muribaculaceae bacterium]